METQLNENEVKAALGFGTMLMEQLLRAQNPQMTSQPPTATPETPETAPESMEMEESDEMPMMENEEAEVPTEEKEDLTTTLLPKFTEILSQELDNFKKELSKTMDEKYQSDIKGIRKEIKNLIDGE